MDKSKKLPEGGFSIEGENRRSIETLMYHLLETELGGVQVYEKAIECAFDDELRSEWQQYLRETREHVEVATELVEAMGLDPDAESPARNLVRIMGKSLVEIMELARQENDPEAAQLAACEAVVQAETKDHQNWELVGELARAMSDDLGRMLLDAYREIEEQEDEHLYHTKGWTRELWLKAMGLPAKLPPPEEERDVRTASDAEKAKRESRRSAAPKKSVGNKSRSRMRRSR
jgi:ferritin-like metal-binding protein YciE